MQPLHDSRAVDSVDTVITWWDKTFGIQPLAVRQEEGAPSVVTFAFQSSTMMGHNATVQYVERPPPETSDPTAKTTSWMQAYLLGNAEKYMTSATSFWPIWGDNHLAFVYNTGPTIDSIIANLDAQGTTLYHPYLGVENGQASFGHTVLYMVDPSGWQIEYHSSFENPANNTDIDEGNLYVVCGSLAHPVSTLSILLIPPVAVLRLVH